MGVLFSTDDVPATERHDYWRSRHRETLGLDFRFLSGRHDRFRARCAVHSLGAMEAAVLSYAGAPVPVTGEVVHAAGPAAQADAYEIKFSIACERFLLDQDGRQAELAPGDFALADLTRPSSAMGGGRWPKRLVSVLIPRAMLGLPPHRVARLTAVRMSGRQGTGALVSVMLRRIAADAGGYHPAEAARVSTALADLLTATLAARLDPRPAVLPDETRRDLLLRHIYGYVDRHLGDPGLSPAAIAAAHSISLRRLHQLFEAEEHTVAEWIRRRRLDRCRRDLADPALADRPVASIAARWGFADAAGFSRLFRAAHGTPPGAYRRLALGGE